MRRDPGTGQFVSDTDSTYRKTATITGSVSAIVPAADLSGSNTTIAADGPPTELVDWDQYLDQDEVAEVVSARFVTQAALPTTSTAEGSLQVTWAVTEDAGVPRIADLNSPFYAAGAQNASDGIVDLTIDTQRDDSVLTGGQLWAEASVGDTVNGVGSGAEYDSDRYSVDYRDMYGTGPVYDQNDSLYAPHQYGVDNVSDHAIAFDARVVLHVLIHTLD